MIILRATRHQVAAFIGECYSYIDASKTTNLKNVPPGSSITEQYLVAVLVNCNIGEVQEAFLKKYHRTKAAAIKMELSDAHAVVLYKVLMFLPIPSNNPFLLAFRAEWIHQLEQGLMQAKICEKRIQEPSAVASAAEWYHP